MNFTQELSQFQGALLSADNTHVFSELSAKGGNEDEISEVISKISKFLELGGFTNNGQITKESTPAMRRFAFYIVLNAQLPILDQMVELEGIDSVIWTITTIPQCLMCELMWNVHMEQFIYEIISCTHPLLALEVSSAFLDNFKYFCPLECLDRLQLLSAACYRTITRLHLLRGSDDDDIASIATAAFNNFQRSIKYFKTPPNDHKLNALSKDELYEYYGNRLHSMLLLITKCVECFTSEIEIKSPGVNLYMLTYKDGTLTIENSKVCDIQNYVLSNCLHVCNTEMLDECKALVMDVSVDVFCGWSEFEDNGKTMQQTIGELCYKVCNDLQKVDQLSQHPLLGMLEQIARKPDEMEDIINATKDDIILQKVDDQSEDRTIWIQSLLHKENLCHNLEFLKVISSNLNLFDQEQCQKLYTLFNDYVKLKLDNHDYVESLMIKVFHQCSLSTKYMILDEHFTNNNFVDMKENSNFNDLMTETFNKFIATPDSDLSDVLTLFLQNPHKVYSKIFVLATENMRQTEVMLKVMNMLKTYSNCYYNSEMEPCIITITQDIIHHYLDTTAKENNFVAFICGLKDADIITGSKLLLLIIMTNLHQDLITKDVNSIRHHIKLIKEAYKLEELLTYRAPMLAMIAKTLDVLRWKMNNFTANRPMALSSTLELQKTLIDTYNNAIIPEKESDWLKSKVGNLQPLNMYYYRALWEPPGNNYLDVVSGSVGNNMSKEELASWMSQVIASCTQQEWCYIWDSLDKEDVVKLDTLLDAIGMITLAERANRTDSTAAALLYCYRNFVYIIRYKYFKEPLTDSQVSTVINHLATIVELVKEDLKEELATLLLPLFAYLSERQKDCNTNYSDFMNQHMKGAALTTIVNKMFKNGTA